MKERQLYQKILNLTAESSWINDPKRVEKVQSLGKKVPIGEGSWFSMKELRGILVLDPIHHQKRYYATVEDCVVHEHLTKATIIQHIKRQTTARDGREFSILLS